MIIRSEVSKVVLIGNDANCFGLTTKYCEDFINIIHRCNYGLDNIIVKRMFGILRQAC